MKRNGSKGVAKKRSVQPTSITHKPVGPKKNRSSAEEREQRIARGARTLKELFAIGERTFKRLDIETIVRAAEDKDLEYI
jgi:hypothetical protein